MSFWNCTLNRKFSNCILNIASTDSISFNFDMMIDLGRLCYLHMLNGSHQRSGWELMHNTGWVIQPGIFVLICEMFYVRLPWGSLGWPRTEHEIKHAVCLPASFQGWGFIFPDLLSVYRSRWNAGTAGKHKGTIDIPWRGQSSCLWH